jgi:DNA-binding GntR family transcriptional regulator
MNRNTLTTIRTTSTAAEQPTAEQQAYDLVKARIMNLEFKPGQYITDNEIANELNISRTPIRDAFRRLEYEGLLTSQPRRGWQVCPLSLDDIHDIFNIKEVLEGMVARQAAEFKDEKLRHILRDVAERMNRAAEVGDQEVWEEAHWQWHETIFAMSYAPRGRVFRVISNLNDQWRRLRKALLGIEGRMKRDTLEHIAVTESILAGDGDEAERRMRSHLNNVRRDLVNLLVNLVFPFVSDGV